MIAALLLAAAAAQPSDAAVFAFIIGVNQTDDGQLPALRYADDDAARYLDLFRALGARTFLLARLDENTRRLHPQAAAEAVEPRMAQFAAQARELQAEVARAQARGVPAVVYVIYAGHGELRNAQGTIRLENGALSGADLSREILSRLGPARVHLIVDACYSFYLAYPRGPGGSRRPAAGFAALSGLAGDDRVGLLLSTSSARESHEWEGFEAGVFHHEVRSGLYGAADSDGDGVVSYREIAAFVDRANASIASERFRPQFYARPPRGGEALLDVRAGLSRRLEIPAAEAGRYQLEDAQGVRLAEFHSAPTLAVRMVRPASRGLLFLRRRGSAQEWPVPAAAPVVRIEEIAPQPERVGVRGAAHEAFEHLFDLPFDAVAVAVYRFPAPPEAVTDPPAVVRRRAAPWILGGAGVLAAASGATALLARSQGSGVPVTASQSDIAARNGRIDTLNIATVALVAAAVAGTVVGIAFLTGGEAP